MQTVLVTGATGFIGKNLCAQLKQDKNVTILRFDKKNTLAELETYIAQADFVFHLAGVNRPKDENEFDSGNRGLTEHIVSLIQKSGKKIPLLVTSSIQATLDNPYGKSKQAAEKIIAAWTKASGSPSYIFRLPNVFGKWCRP